MFVGKRYIGKNSKIPKNLHVATIKSVPNGFQKSLQKFDVTEVRLVRTIKYRVLGALDRLKSDFRCLG